MAEGPTAAAAVGAASELRLTQQPPLSRTGQRHRTSRRSQLTPPAPPQSLETASSRCRSNGVAASSTTPSVTGPTRPLAVTGRDRTSFPTGPELRHAIENRHLPGDMPCRGRSGSAARQPGAEAAAAAAVAARWADYQDLEVVEEVTRQTTPARLAADPTADTSVDSARARDRAARMGDAGAQPERPRGGSAALPGPPADRPPSRARTAPGASASPSSQGSSGQPKPNEEQRKSWDASSAIPSRSSSRGGAPSAGFSGFPRTGSKDEPQSRPSSSVSSKGGSAGAVGGSPGVGSPADQVQNPTRDPALDPFRDPTRDLARDQAHHTPRDKPRDPSRNTGRGPSNDLSPDPSHNPARDLSRGHVTTPRPQSTTTAYRGWFQSQRPTSVWQISNSLEDQARAERRRSSAGSAPLPALSLLTSLLMATLMISRC